MRKLRIWLRENGLTNVALAKALGYHPVHITGVLTGRRRIGNNLAHAIVQFTRGEVTYNDLFEVKGIPA